MSVPSTINNFPLIVKLWGHLSLRRKRQFIIYLFLSFFGGLFEVVSLGLVIPFIGVLTAPEKVLDIEIVSNLASYFNIQNANELILPITICFIAITVVSGLYRLLLLYLITKLSFFSGHDFSIDIFRKTINQPYLIHTSRNTSTIIDVIIVKVGGAVAAIQTTCNLINSLIIIVMVLGTLFVIDPFISGLVLFIFTFFYLLTSFFNRSSLKRNSSIISLNNSLVIKNVQESLGGIREVIIDSSQELFSEIFRENDRNMKLAQASNSIISNSPKFIIESISMVIIALLAFLLSKSEMGLIDYIPVLGALAVAAQRLLPAAQQCFSSWSTIKGGNDSLYDVLKLLNQEIKTPKSISINKDNVSFENYVELKDLNFKYPDSKTFSLSDINFKLRKGSSIGIIGETGSGKSTLVDIIIGLLKPSSGSIIVDDITLEDSTLRGWQKKISHVSQFIFLTDDNFENNIAFGSLEESLDRDRVISSAKKAHIHNFIQQHEESYNHIIGERGVKLSGGQRQRIGIARAMYKERPILILDEATSALDTITEKQVLQSIKELDSGVTIIMIAHRFTTLKDCDIILELDGGKIIRSGTYDEVISEKI